MLGITVAKWRKIKARLAPMLIFYGPENEQKITQKRCQKEWNYVAGFREKQREKGKRSGAVRRHKNQGLSSNQGSFSVDGNATQLNAEKRTGTRTSEPQPEANTSPNKSITTTSSTLSPREKSKIELAANPPPAPPHSAPTTRQRKGPSDPRLETLTMRRGRLT